MRFKRIFYRNGINVLFSYLMRLNRKFGLIIYLRARVYIRYKRKPPTQSLRRRFLLTFTYEKHKNNKFILTRCKGTAFC